VNRCDSRRRDASLPRTQKAEALARIILNAKAQKTSHGFFLVLIRVNPRKSVAKNLTFLFAAVLASALNGAGQGLVERGLGLGVLLVGNLPLFVLHFKLEKLFF
jgi:hypothetical protein